MSGAPVAESEAARICNSLGLPDRVLGQPLRPAVAHRLGQLLPAQRGRGVRLRVRDVDQRRGDEPLLLGEGDPLGLCSPRERG